jgi:hypothetical protein
MPNPGIPAHAAGHLPPQAIEGLSHTPVAVQAPNLIFDNAQQPDHLTGTPGQVDYFVYDESQYQNAQGTREGDFIIGFETGSDKVVFVNSDPSAHLDIMNGITGAYGDPTKGDSVVLFQDSAVIGSPDVPIIFQDVSNLTSADFLFFRNDPFDA